MKRIVASALLIFLFLLPIDTPAHAGVIEPDLEKAFSRTGTEQEISVILTFKDKVDVALFRDGDKGLLRSKLIKALREKAESTQAPIKLFLEEEGVKQIHSLWSINGMLFSAKPSTIKSLANQPGIERVRLDATQSFRDRFKGIRRNRPRNLKNMVRESPKRQATLSDPPPFSITAKPEWNVDLIRAPEFWKNGGTGEGIIVANMDTGVDVHHPDLSNKWRGGKNSWFDPHREHETPFDANGHGTQTMSIMVGGSAGGTAIGIAPGAKWIAIKIYNDAGQTSLGHCHLGFQWLLDPDGNPETDDLPDVVNFSWGFNQNVNQCNPEFMEDIRVLKAAQVAVIFAGGNEGSNSSTSLSPANYGDSLSVGAIDQSLNTATFSSRGPSACDDGIYPKVIAPGVSIKTADLTLRGFFPKSYATVTGTSFAAAHVSGAIALFLSAFRDLTVSEMESALKTSAKGLLENEPNNDYGHGLIDLIKAYQMISSKRPL